MTWDKATVPTNRAAVVHSGAIVLAVVVEEAGVVIVMAAFRNAASTINLTKAIFIPASKPLSATLEK
jgi:ribosomal protein L16/L10AE